MQTAPFSWRAATNRAPSACRLVVNVKFPLPTTPKNVSTPAWCRQRATTSTTLIGGDATARRYGGAMAVSAPATPAALSARGVVRPSAGGRFLDGLAPGLPPRAGVGLMGANGSGKSALLRLPSGADEADAGTV